jgi:phosphoserine phosphatase RsbU/P
MLSGSGKEFAMEPRAIPPRVALFLRKQQSYIAVAVAVYATFWAIDPLRNNAIVTLIYSLCLCNSTVVLQSRLRVLNAGKGLLRSWLTYLAALFALTPVMVTLATFAAYAIATSSPRIPFADYLGAGWKFPSVATLIFGVALELYRTATWRLEKHNNELERTVQRGLAEVKQQGQELQQAREIQQSLLPKEMPQVVGYEIDGAWEPARVVGGDYFDVIQLSETRLGICIADVVGKSISAALLMANVQASVRAFALQTTNPATLCGRVNSVLCNNIASGKFVTMFYGVLDSEQSQLCYTNAGHLRPILMNARGEARPLENGGALLGVFPDWTYEDSVVQLSEGDRLLLFTDGITEAAKPDGEEFGEERLISLARTGRRKSTAELKDLLLAEVKQFCALQLADDATLIVISVLSGQEGGGEQAPKACAMIGR